MANKENYLLAINCGSSSLKLTLFDGLKKRLFDYNGSLGNLKAILDKEIKFALPKLKGIGHRFVHGGDKFYEPTLITPKTLKELKKLKSLAPLHNPICLKGIEEALSFAPDVPQLAVFDTAFHHHMPKVAKQYAISSEYGIRRYGFHGIAHKALIRTFSEHVQKNAKVITLQLGNGCSAAAVLNGKCLDTTMGFTPAEGLMMGTRAGDIDSAVMPYLCSKLHKTPDQIMKILNDESGLLGVSQVSSNMKDLLKSKKIMAREAIDLFCYRIVKVIGSYIAVLGGLDALIFSGGIGENAAQIREKILSQLSCFGLNLDLNSNQIKFKLAPGAIHKISLKTSSAAVYVASVDENEEIGRELLQME